MELATKESMEFSFGFVKNISPGECCQFPTDTYTKSNKTQMSNSGSLCLLVVVVFISAP